MRSRPTLPSIRPRRPQLIRSRPIDPLGSSTVSHDTVARSSAIEPLTWTVPAAARTEPPTDPVMVTLPATTVTSPVTSPEITTSSKAAAIRSPSIRPSMEMRLPAA